MLLVHLSSSCVKDRLRRRRSTSVSTGRLFHSSYVILASDVTPFPNLKLFLALVLSIFRGHLVPYKLVRPPPASTVFRRCRCRVLHLLIRVPCLDGDAVSSSLLCLFRRLGVLGWSPEEQQSSLGSAEDSGLELRLLLQPAAPILLSSGFGPTFAFLHRLPSACFLICVRFER